MFTSNWIVGTRMVSGGSLPILHIANSLSAAAFDTLHGNVTAGFQLYLYSGNAGIFFEYLSLPLFQTWYSKDHK